MPGWLTPSAVAQHANVAGVSPTSIPLANACAAAEVWVENTARPDLDWVENPPADVKLGGIMLAWRWYQRRDTPLGAVMTSTGDPVELLRNDPDIARLLGVSGGGGFVFGATGPAGPVVTT